MPAVPIVAAPARLKARGICKQFPGVRALEDVSLRLEAGEVLAVIGENGAGKSTLMKILAGVLPADRGELWIEGKRAFVRSVQDATAAGIALIHQELNLCDNLDVAANLYFGRESRRGPFLNRRRQRAQAAAVLESLALAIAPETLVGTLSVGMRQMVEIAKALSTEARILIMDEPTSSLTHREAARLFALIDQLRRRGVSVIYISHRLSEVQQVADRVEVLRDGRSAGGLTRQEISHAAMVRLMVGRDLVVEPRAARGPPRNVALEARQLRTAAFPQHPLQFQIRGGEIVGMGGLVGAGRTELLTTLFGLVPAAGGDVLVAGKRVPPGDCAAAIAAGMALVPEDRKATGAVLDFSIRENVSLGGLRRWTRWRIGLDHVRERRLAEDSVRRLAIRAEHRTTGAAALRRQPAEGRARQVARLPPAAAADGRADAGRGRRRQAGNLPLDAGTGGGRRRRAVRLQRTGRAVARVRAAAGHAPGTNHRSAGTRSLQRTSGDAPRDRLERGGRLMHATRKLTGILLLLLYVCVTTALLNDAFVGPYNLQNLLRYISLFGIIGIGAVMVIITGGIDLSMGSLIGLTGCAMTLMLNGWADLPAADNVAFLVRIVGLEAAGVAAWAWMTSQIRGRRRGQPLSGRRQAVLAGVFLAGLGAWLAARGIAAIELPAWMTIPVCLTLVLLLAVHLGLLHGLLITKLRLQPFVVTLCGLMGYRGLSRWLANDKNQGFGTRYDDSLRLLANGQPCTVAFVLLAAGIGLIAWGLLQPWWLRESPRRWLWAGTYLLLGVMLAGVGGSKFARGWQTTYSEPMFSVGSFDVRHWTVSVDKESQQRPAELMRYAAGPFAISAAALLALVARRTWRGPREGRRGYLLAALALGVLGFAGLVAVKRWIGDTPVMLDALSRQKLAQLVAVLGTMACVLVGIFSVASSVSRGRRPVEQALALIAAVTGMLWLLSQTQIHNTKVQVPFFILLVVALIAAVFLNQTIYGRYLFALGKNEEATRYSGIDTDRMVIVAYVICAACGGLGGILFTLDSNNVEPSGHGSFYELYAIAAAVLGGCSLRGGEGSILGVILGAAIMRILFNAPNMIGVSQQLELFTMGIVILFGVIADEQLRRWAARRAVQAGERSSD